MTGDSPNIQRVSGFLEDHRLFVLIGIQFLAGRQDNLEALEQFVKRTIRQRRIAPDAAGSLTPTPQS